MLNEKITDLFDRQDSKQQNITLISEEEKKRRQEAFQYAQASIALEGFSFSAAFTQEIDHFIKGKIDFSSLTNRLHEITKR